MISTKTLHKHAGLVDRMASANGIDLEESALRGDVTPGEISDAVVSCTNCTNPEDCGKWLDTQAQDANTPPGYCRNTALFDRLKED
ncbi:MAG: DUF6455 family protein [Pseudomonadota bacterium]